MENCDGPVAVMQKSKDHRRKGYYSSKRRYKRMKSDITIVKRILELLKTMFFPNLKTITI